MGPVCSPNRFSPGFACFLVFGSCRFRVQVLACHLWACVRDSFSLSISGVHHGLDFQLGFDQGIAVLIASRNWAVIRVAVFSVVSRLPQFSGVICRLSMVSVKVFQYVQWCCLFAWNCGGLMFKLITMAAWSKSPPLPGSQDHPVVIAVIAVLVKVSSGKLGLLFSFRGNSV